MLIINLMSCSVFVTDFNSLLLSFYFLGSYLPEYLFPCSIAWTWSYIQELLNFRKSNGFVELFRLQKANSHSVHVHFQGLVFLVIFVNLPAWDISIPSDIYIFMPIYMNCVLSATWNWWWSSAASGQFVSIHRPTDLHRAVARSRGCNSHKWLPLGHSWLS